MYISLVLWSFLVESSFIIRLYHTCWSRMSGRINNSMRKKFILFSIFMLFTWVSSESDGYLSNILPNLENIIFFMTFDVVFQKFYWENFVKAWRKNGITTNVIYMIFLPFFEAGFCVLVGICFRRVLGKKPSHNQVKKFLV